MSKKNKNKNGNGNGNGGVKKVQRTVVVDDVKKAVAKGLINNILAEDSFPKVSDTFVKGLAEASKISEKTIKAFCTKIEKFVNTISRGKKEKKGKEVDADLQKQIQEAATNTATTIATKLFKTPATFVKMLVLKKGKKKENAYGKAIFVLGAKQEGKEMFLCWDYKEGDLFVGSTLHEYTEEIKKKDAGEKKKKDKEEKK